MSARDKVSLVLLVFMSFFLMADMYITPAIIPELIAEFGVTEQSIGWAGTAFMLLGALVGLAFGYMNDRFSRKKLLIFAVVIGEIPCLLTGLAFVTVNFEMFVVMRTLTGFGVGGIFPITFSLLSDYVSERRRGVASAVVDIAWGLGILSGPLLAAFALSTEYGWRLAFVIAALPSFPLILVYWFVGSEPKRGQSELCENHVNAPQVGMFDIFKIRTNVILFLQGIPGSLPWGLLPFWVITFFREERNMAVIDATALWEIFGICTVIGGLIWATIGDRLFQIKARYVPLLCSGAILIGLIPEYLLFNVPFTSQTSYIILAAIGGLLISVTSANVRAMLMNVNKPNTRGKVFSTYNFFDSLGKGMGPIIGGVMIANTQDYQFMVNVALVFWLVCACILSLSIFTIDKDRADLQLQ